VSYEIVHTFGSTIYFVFTLLFLWLSRIPRTEPGSAWWAISLTSALVARLSLFLLTPLGDMKLVITVYAIFNILEKPFLLTGVARFLNLNVKTRWFWIAAAAAELWVLVAWVADFPSLVRTSGYSLFNTGVMLYIAWASSRRSDDILKWPLRATAVASGLLAMHWMSAPILMQFFPVWFQNAFVLGTILVLVQYMSLMVAVLSLFQQRLLDAETKALDLALLDPLTGLNNRRYMNTLFDHALLLATRPHHIVAVFYVDLDNFKPINDTAGHAVGDEVLKAVAAGLKGNMRSTDICARVGGDEFVVIGTQLENENQAHAVARKLLLQLTRHIEINGAKYALGASIGVSLYPRHGTNLPDLIQCADQAMYRVKRNGKSGYEIYAAPASAEHSQPDQTADVRSA